jgi:hypothetical protein
MSNESAQHPSWILPICMIYGGNQGNHQKTLVKSLCIIYWKNNAVWEVRAGADVHRIRHPMTG